MATRPVPPLARVSMLLALLALGCASRAERTPPARPTVEDTPAIHADDPPSQPPGQRADERAIIQEAVRILAELGSLAREHQGDCDAMARALERFAENQRARLQAHRERASAIPIPRRADLMRDALARESSLHRDLEALDACAQHPGVNAQLDRLR